MKLKLVIFIFIIISGCESYTSQYETEMKVCAKGEELGMLDVAIKACEKAAEIAETHKLSFSLRSQSLYKLGRLKRKQGVFSDAEKILEKTIALEIEQNKPDKQLIAACLLELSLSMAGQNQWLEGSVFIQRLIPLVSQLSEEDRLITKNTVKHYATQLNTSQRPELLEMFNNLLTKL